VNNQALVKGGSSDVTDPARKTLAVRVGVGVGVGVGVDRQDEFPGRAVRRRA
jgi:hypothetical protein